MSQRPGRRRRKSDPLARPSELRSSPALPAPAESTDLLPIGSFLGAMLFGMTAYFVAEAAIQGGKHPLHWLAALVGGLVGYLAGLLYSRLRPY